MAKVLIAFIAFVILTVVVAGSVIPSTITVQGKFGPINLEIDEETAAVLEAHPFVSYIGQYGNKKYYTHYYDKTYSEANLFCKSVGFDLVSIANATEAEYLFWITSSRHLWTSGYSKVIWETGNTEVTLPIVGANPSEFRLRYNGDFGATAKQLIASTPNDPGFPLCQVVTVPQ